MRGAPLLQAILIVVAFLLAGVPVYRLTRPAAAATSDSTPGTPAADPTPANSAPMEIEVTCAPAPIRFEISNLGQTVLSGHQPTARFAGRWTASVPPEGVDLVVLARWPKEGSPHAPAGADPGAMRVIVRFPGGRQAEKTFWADASGELNDVFTVSGEVPAATP